MTQLPIIYLAFLFLSFSSIAQESVYAPHVDLETTHLEDWENYVTTPDFTIEYRLENCDTNALSNQAIVLFKITNLSDQSQTISWSKELWRNGACSNCHDIDSPEGAFSVTILPHESIEGDCSSKDNKALYIFRNFIELTPGMSKQTLTGFRLVSLKITNEAATNE
ncbi:MAG: hypothetical protein A3D31_17235 [Candidatus Fluviicola riflensis]|nr:MAG: hypothetical protein CHH17_02175 [Candidatus Fluviicola riflensis]OGS76730.1 MAG: hypothetical protein A3D31_17235 [Candidatus Fluviicola riflensis]OGS82915.1 MAG: hypothetical protein A2724_14125 [Fluviicola sp. RIFCSPHIGHO2_01_FULL_43_53]OGS88460.1 MAG: hypothetical protein A3E30_06740 [Fluviicola sp. RIFCSPHIGHO2_12_FULL_43_24]